MTPEHYTILSLLIAAILLSARALIIQNKKNREAEKELERVSEYLVCECEKPNVDNTDKPLPTCKECFRPMV